MGLEGAAEAAGVREALALSNVRDGPITIGHVLAGACQPDLVGYHLDPFTCPIDDLADLEPTLTMVDGPIVHPGDTAEREAT